MSNGINTVILQGEICWPELKYVGNDKALYRAKLKIPSSDFKTGEERHTFIRIVAWEQFAEYMDSLAPRTKVRVSGRIQERSYENREGQKQTSTEVILEGVEVVETEQGENSFTLQGQIVWPDLKSVGDRQTSLFRSKVKIPYIKHDGTPGNSYVRITAWGDEADGLSALGEGSNVKVTGHIQDRSWNDPRTGQKKTFTDIVVTNYTGA